MSYIILISCSSPNLLALAMVFFKVLEPCNQSLAYQPPNPWTMGILSLLVEIYNLPNLKMNLKFDIEVSLQYGPFGMRFGSGFYVLSLIRLYWTIPLVNRC